MTETHAACKETIDALLAENRALRAETPRIDGRPSECVRLRESNEKLLAALEYYRDQWDCEPAEPGTYCFVPSIKLLGDRGEIARAAIANATESPTRKEDQ
jgi:hypothetical protein